MREPLPERRVEFATITTNTGKRHVEVEGEDRPDPYRSLAYIVVCGAPISDGYRSRSGGLVTCQRCLRAIAGPEGD